jgi:peptide/nickel transport system substrate-binding protein
MLNHSGERPAQPEVDTLKLRNSLVAKSLVGLASLALVATLGSCAQSQREPEGTSSEGGTGGGGTFVFAASADPAMLDPALASDGETFRVSRQMFEGLVGAAPGTTDVEPLLATKWETTPDGKSHTFTLREGVKFHDGTDFNAEAVCTNFERWYNWTGLNQNENITYYYGKIFRGYKTGKTGSIYAGCTAASPTEVTIKLTVPFASFVQAMTLPAFSMQSPKALEEFDADNTTGTVDDTRFSVYATEHPTGTGPYKFEKWERDQAVTLKANPDYWGDKAKTETVIIRTISDTRARVQELEAGSIDGFDLVGPGDVQALQDKGYQIQNRPAFNILYLAFNQATPALKKLQVRQALNHAIDKEAVLKSSLPPRLEGRRAVHARPGQRLQPRRPHLRVRRGEGQGTAQGGGRGEPHPQVRLPDRRLTALHADAGGHLPGAEVPARGGRDHHHARRRQVASGLPGPHHRPGRDGQAGHPPAGLDR